MTSKAAGKLKATPSKTARIISAWVCANDKFTKAPRVLGSRWGLGSAEISQLRCRSIAPLNPQL